MATKNVHPFSFVCARPHNSLAIEWNKDEEAHCAGVRAPSKLTILTGLQHSAARSSHRAASHNSRQPGLDVARRALRHAHPPLGSEFCLFLKRATDRTYLARVCGYLA